jgi:hypothetical protein
MYSLHLNPKIQQKKTKKRSVRLMLRAVQHLDYSGDLRTAGSVWIIVHYFTLQITTNEFTTDQDQENTINYIFVKFPALRAPKTKTDERAAGQLAYV